MKTLFKDEFNQVVVDEDHRVVRLTRTAVHYPDIKAVDTSLSSSHAAMHKAARRDLGALVDLRQGPMRNDPEFEAVTAKYRFKFAEGYGRSAVLVRTAVGKLQLSRLGREAHREIPIFDDEDAALRFLAEGLASR